MPNVLTHKYLKSNEIQSNAVLPGAASAVIDVYYDMILDDSETFTVTFVNGTSEISVDDQITFSGGAVGKVETVVHLGGTWAGGDEQGQLVISQLTANVGAGESATTNTGGAYTVTAAFTLDSLRDTSITDCSDTAVKLDGYVAGDYLQPKGDPLNPTNAIPWTESGISSHFDTLIMFVSKSTSSLWTVSYGNNVGVLGYVLISGSSDSVTLMDTDGAPRILSLPAGTIPHDGEAHVIAVILRRDLAAPTMSIEIDGIVIDSIAISQTADIQLTAENTILFSQCRMNGFLACCFKDGLPADYQETVAEMGANWIAGKKGISPELLGMR